MQLLGNILWFILGGWWSFLLYALLGVLFCITIIGIPIGKSLFQYAKLMAFPFGKVIMKETEIKGKENVAAVRRVGGLIANILWLPFGIAAFVVSIGTMIVCTITIILIPVAVVLAKSCVFLLWPVGAKVVTKEEAEAIRMRNAMVQAQAMTGGQPVQQAAPVQPVAAPVLETAQPAQTMAAAAVTAAAVDAAQAAQPVQAAQPAQPNQTMENLKAGGTQVLDAVKETGSKAATTIAQKSQEGMSALKNMQNTTTQQVLAMEREFTLEELLVQLEVKLYRNKIMAWIMPFLEYITLAVGIIAVLSGMISMRRLGFGYVMLGAFSGILRVSSLMLLAAVFGMIKRKHIFVLCVLGVQLLAYLILGFAGFGFSFLPILCYIGVIAWYVLTFVKKIDLAGMIPAKKADAVINTAAADNIAQTNDKAICSKCGAQVEKDAAFCPVCGNKMN